MSMSSSFNNAISDLQLCELLLSLDLSTSDLSEVAGIAEGITTGAVRQLARRTRDRFVAIAKRAGRLGDRRMVLDGTLAAEKGTPGERAAVELLAKFTARDESGALLLKPPSLRRAS